MLPPNEKQENLQADSVKEDRISECAEMYPVFCTANIPGHILDEFIDESYAGCFAMVDDGDVGGTPCILTTTDLDSITHGSRKPMEEFESPFLNMTDEDIRTWMNGNHHRLFAETTFTMFTILDENTIRHKICRTGYIDQDDPDYRMLWMDFYAHLFVRVPIEMCTTDWDTQEGVRTSKVFDRKTVEKIMRKQG